MILLSLELSLDTRFRGPLGEGAAVGAFKKKYEKWFFTSGRLKHWEWITDIIFPRVVYLFLRNNHPV